MRLRHRIMVALLAAALWPAAGVGVPAVRTPLPVPQPDGTTLHVVAQGDERGHTLATVDGRPVARGADGALRYVLPSGSLSAAVAHDPAERLAAERALAATLAPRREFAPREATQPEAAVLPRRVVAVTEPKIQREGTPRVPVLLVGFADKALTTPTSQLALRFGQGDRSARQYFADQSAGRFEPQFELHGPYTLPDVRATYGANDSNGRDVGVGALVRDAVASAGATVDWSRYDNDGDGRVDALIVLYAGVAESQAVGIVPQAVWPCQWSLTEAGEAGEQGVKAITTAGGTVIDNFVVINELRGYNERGSEVMADGPGILCHEFGHCLGLPDFYPTVKIGYYGMGSWSVMDNGCYADNGNTPVGYSAYEKNWMGWLTLTEAVEGVHYTLPPMGGAGERALRLTSPVHPAECYVVECRRRKGWDAYLPAEGVMISHATYVANRWARNTVNNGDVQLMTLFAADNELSNDTEAGDLYGTANHALTDTSVPAAVLYLAFSGLPTGNAGKMGRPITEIILNADGTASLWVSRGVTPQPVRGDLNGDRLVDIDDVNLLVNVLLRKTTDPATAALADLDASGVVDIDDLNTLLNIMLGKI